MVSHAKGGMFEWSSAKVRLHLDPSQTGNKRMQGEKLHKALEGLNPFNANLLDYLLANTHLIPEDWKKDENGNTRYVFFHGTVYSGRDGSRCVRYLGWDSNSWCAHYCWLGSDWGVQDPSAVPA